MKLLFGRTVLVSGAARGLGRTMAHLAAREGARVAVVDIDLRSWRRFAGEAELMRGETTADEIVEAGGDAAGFEGDLSDPGRTRALVAEVVDRFGGLDSVIAFAGGGSGGIAENAAGVLGLDALTGAIQRNLVTTVTLCTAAAPYLAASPGGSIVTMSSLNGRTPTDAGTYSHYGVAKAAVAMYTRYLARDLGPRGVRANCIAPGTVPTGRLTEVWAASGRSISFGQTALGRAPSAEEICQAALFFASDLSSYVTGQVLAVDGGID